MTATMAKSAASAGRSLITYRVQDLPGASDKECATLLIESAVGLSPGCSDLKVHSLANDPYYSGRKTATITSKDLADVLPEAALRDRWEFDLPEQPSYTDKSEHHTSSLTIDTHFEGITPLNSFDDDDGHQYE
jgi:hypothetical protein